MAALTPKQLQAAALLASGVTITETAEKTATTRQTLHQWLKTDDAFIAHLNGLKHEIIDSGRAAIQTAAALAISTITALMTDSAKDEVRLAAAKEILMMAGLKKASTIGSDSADKLKKARIKNAAFDAIFD
ncbi:MAG: phBC6A51 family helix-turn-helix protein [Methylovulum sp.]|nr:phBC6A51 family helix-turn-helix protein [Methylovulum sp.]